MIFFAFAKAQLVSSLDFPHLARSGNKTIIVLCMTTEGTTQACSSKVNPVV